MTEEQLSKMFDNLQGKKKHYCIEWDFLPIDETCAEFDCCTCVFSEEVENA